MTAQDNTKQFSFELFPPKTEKGIEKMRQTVTQLNLLKPAYFSVTYGAGGSTQSTTFAAVDWLRSEEIETAPHISCIGASKDEIDSLLQRYIGQGITRLVALRGDLPSGAGLGEIHDFSHADELVAYIRETTGDHFHIEVAAYPEFHPQATDPFKDIEYFANKVSAGANAAITQYFYNADAYFRFVDACEALNVTVPIVPGIMPITNYSSLARFSDSCGAEIPRWIRRRLEAFGDDTNSIRSFGADVVSDMCERLIANGAPGLHFYTMNQAGATQILCDRLGITG
ncbi:methylenetetrahydrofolate reductase [NAD(P)H] [Solemya velum gill symbiont]|uniref:Methylenetetrahydrofolate reductase n=1 Tax=Solemya velum gill symbiont TaxID=2340 RepID=A0A0B0HCE4_SOVGS|nr:methylenetetrahydrofolate reductase [NAD(P)H] [Solemya velum gill symbiont]KHF25554.1 5,10-methylenetetrahydrofolate reductase [Solemya velum gill symbiont]OOY35385.1 methylenetetrahydrofolate reductase [NAD(P)H] [Solemya velum gill symbiont]OOY38025.1 methylenetetrahydrofolate reductase [NAD(P)H] [Solemya velum gill symbiont]OOY43698.1 methylenetetrahydrofolate reductase [NAD(P)H] [Solemya velum gill symbiont]OOY48100.1 methylenetetrahydrofolate reductase [NAD(P)H] [Solemya velum gill symb